MKLFKRKNLMGLIYGIFVLLPFCAILSRVIYVQSNKNAYESYYGETINQEKIHIGYKDKATYYYLNITDVVPTTTTTTYNVEEFKYSGNVPATIQNNYQYVNQLVFWEQSGTYYVRLGFTNDTPNYFLAYSTYSTTTFSFYIVNSSSNFLNNYIYYKTFNQYSYLDNVFEYSVNKFIDDNNFGKLDFFQWFSTLFLDSNSVNNMYVHFVNWYMNYLLYVSLGYLIFSVLMWFVNFFRGLVEKSTELNL